MARRSRWHYALCALAFVCGGCRLVSIDEPDAPFFEAAIGGVAVEGVGVGRMEREHVFQLWGQFAHPDSSFRFIEFSIANFNNTGTFSLEQLAGSYGLIDDRERVVRLARSYGVREDQVRIDRFSSPGLVQGAFSFQARALANFDNIVSGDDFIIEGAFLIELK